MTATVMLDADKNIIVEAPGLSAMITATALDADDREVVIVLCLCCGENTVERVIEGESFEIGHAPGCELEARIRAIVAAHPELTVGWDFCPPIPFPLSKKRRPSEVRARRPRAVEHGTESGT